jgi:hypothetical protein
MKVRHLTLVVALALGIAAASPARALANDCPSSDSPDGTTQAACDDSMPAADGSPAASVGADDVSVPTVDADGDPIPYVEETTAPPPGTSLIFASDGE